MPTRVNQLKFVIHFLRHKQVLKDLIYFGINLSVISWIYKKMYYKAIKEAVESFKLSDLSVSIETTNTCNLKCIMCPYEKMTRPKEIMPTELFKKIVDDCTSQGITNYNLNFYNEPFLDPSIFERIKYLKSKNCKVKLYTNGFVLEPGKWDQLFESKIDQLNFSFDALTAATYEKIRRGSDFNTVKNNILNLIEERNRRHLIYPKICLVYVRQKDNFHETKSFEEYWKPYVHKIFFSQDDARLDCKDKKSFLILRQKKHFYPCRKLWQEITVVSSGKVVLCCMDFDASVCLGDFKRQTLSEIWSGAVYSNIRELHLNFVAHEINYCNSCPHVHRQNARSWWI